MAEIAHPDAPPGKASKYAQRERERRFLLAEMPAGEVVRTAVLSDRYIDGTRVRLRRMVDTVAGVTTTIYKLTQKVPAADGRPGLTTNFYLNAAEHERFAALPAHTLEKTRYGIPPFVVDVFAAPRDGLFLAEVELESDEALAAIAQPSFAVAEVTQDVRFTGGRLATTSRAELAEALASYGIPLA